MADAAGEGQPGQSVAGWLSRRCNACLMMQRQSLSQPAHHAVHHQAASGTLLQWTTTTRISAVHQVVVGGNWEASEWAVVFRSDRKSSEQSPLKNHGVMLASLASGVETGVQHAHSTQHTALTRPSKVRRHLHKPFGSLVERQGPSCGEMAALCRSSRSLWLQL